VAEPLIKQEPKSQRLEIKRYGFSVFFDVSADGMECRCSYEPSLLGGTPMTADELQAFLTQYKISEGIIPEAVANLLHSAECSKTVTGLLLAQGTLMVPGKDGQLILAVSDALTSVEEDDGEETGTMNLRNVQSFFNVEVGQLIATVLPPGPGEAGKNIFGKVIPPQPGSPFPLVLGLNVQWGDDGRNIFTTAAGRVCVKGDEISVEDIYVINGDIDFKVGNVNINGFVEIKGDIRDGFTVKATKGIKVRGIIGVCTIESDGDIQFSGMNGQGTGTISCGGSITANYIYDTSVVCAGDVTVDVEIRNAQIKALGAIRVSKKGIVGGEYFALAGIECATLGNVASLPTHVVAGAHYHDLEELNRLFNELKQLITHFNSSPKETVNVKEFAQQRADITCRTQEVRSRTYDRCNPKINVRNILYEGVYITLGNQSEVIKEERKGPVSIIENTFEGEFRFLGMTDLSIKAQDIEQTFVKQQQLKQ
jgi:uncharacterized protein (DUF342 family)